MTLLRSTNSVKTEGSMKTMSWSRYHCLAWSFLRVRGGLRWGGPTRRHRAAADRSGRRGQRPAAADKAGKARPANAPDS